ncbi:hypothetical protein GGR50DRAFT_660592 [Xylaria sp. CBS 124048]|nr:hypothetical protein GGR50DRAFT_660592 [Xylaria sp. CBS 124048]
MESRNAPRDHATVSHPPSSRQLENVSDSESSDSNDDDIPAITTNRLSVSPSKSLSVTSASKPVSATAPANLHANPLKKSLTEAARGGIVLYPGSKRQRTGYNMRPNSVESSSHLSPVALRPPPKTDPSPPNSPGTNTEDDVRQGLVSNMNNAFRHLKPAQSQDPVEQWPRNEEGSASPHLGEADPAESGEGKSTDNRHPGLSPVNRQRSPSEIGSMISPTENGLCEEPSEASQAAHHEAKATEDKNETGDAVSSPMGEVPVLGRENPAGVEMQAQVGATSRNTSEYDVEVPQSPVGPDRQDVPQSTSNNQKSQHTKKRSRSPKISKTRFPNKSMRSEGVTSPRELLSRATETDSIQQGQAEDSEQVNQNSDAHPSASVPGVIQTQAPKTTTPSNRISPTSNRSQTAKPNFQAKSGRAKDAAPTVNLTVPNDRAGNLNGLSRMSNHDNDSGNHEYINEYSSTNLRATVDDEPSSDFLDGFSVDFGDDDATYSPAEDSDVPEDPSDDDITAIHMDHQPLWQLCELLGDTAWGGMKGGWQWQDFDYSGAATEPARALLPLLTKLERLCKDAPRAPNLKEQSKFLRRHNDLLDYYADKIATVVEHIRTQRIEIPEHNATTRNTDPGKRKRMTRDLVLYGT